MLYHRFSSAIPIFNANHPPRPRREELDNESERMLILTGWEIVGFVPEVALCGEEFDVRLAREEIHGVFAGVLAEAAGPQGGGGEAGV